MFKEPMEKMSRVWYMYMMLAVFWPLSLFEYFRLSRYLKQHGKEWNWGIQIGYMFIAPPAILIMTVLWYFIYVKLK